jgi:hypothetical protein
MCIFVLGSNIFYNLRGVLTSSSSKWRNTHTSVKLCGSHFKAQLDFLKDKI